MESQVSDDDHPIRQALAAYQAAVLAKDVDAFVAIYADDARIFELWGRWPRMSS